MQPSTSNSVTSAPKGPSSLAELCFAAGFKLRVKEPRWYPESIVEIAAGLLEMRRAGLLQRLYVDAGIIRIGYGKQLMKLDHEAAAQLVKVFRKQKEAA